MEDFGLSKTRLFTCIIAGCRLFGESICADIQQIKRHLLKQHHPQELVAIAKLYSIIPIEESYHNYDWIAHEIAHLCVIRD